MVKLLAVILVILHIALSATVAELSTERIVVHRLNDITLGTTVILRHLTDIAEMVTVVIVRIKSCQQ